MPVGTSEGEQFEDEAQFIFARMDKAPEVETEAGPSLGLQRNKEETERIESGGMSAEDEWFYGELKENYTRSRRIRRDAEKMGTTELGLVYTPEVLEKYRKTEEEDLFKLFDFFANRGKNKELNTKPPPVEMET